MGQRDDETPGQDTTTGCGEAQSHLWNGNGSRMTPIDWIRYILAFAFLAVWILAGVIVVRQRC